MITEPCLIPIEQIQLPEDQALKMYNLHIMKLAPSSLDSQLVERMISISFHRDCTEIFTKKGFQNGFLFNVGKIISVESGKSNKCATIDVDYGENGVICKVDICFNDYVTDKVKTSNKCYQWRLLEF
jgi:hypothetical protein